MRLGQKVNTLDTDVVHAVVPYERTAPSWSRRSGLAAKPIICVGEYEEEEEDWRSR